MTVTFLSLQGHGGTSVPYERRNAPYSLSSIATNPQDSLRLKRYEEHWRFYSGVQWSFTREDGEPLVTANYCRAVVNKKASFLVGNGMVVQTPEAIEEITKPVLDEVWSYNQQDRLLLEMAITGGVTGDVFLLVTYQPPTDQQKAINPYTEGKIRIRLLGSHQVFPSWNPLNHEELQHVRIITEITDQSAVDEKDVRTPMTVGSLGVQRKRRYIEDIYPDRIAEGWDDGPRTIRANDLGEIPLVHISNVPFPHEYYGYSDLDDLIDIQREFNEKLTDVSDIINYNASPVTVILGARAKNLEKGPKALWALPQTEAKVFNLEQKGELLPSYNYITLIREIMFDIAGLPEGSLGRMQNISNTSAAALQTQFQPLVEATARKTASYTAGLQKVNYFILRYHQLTTGETFPVDLCKSCGGRIVEQTDTGADGREKVSRRCFLINKQTLEFLEPEEVQIHVRRKFSFGVETRTMPFGQAKKEHLQKGASFWDPQAKEDLQDKEDDRLDRNLELQEFMRDEQIRVQEDQHSNRQEAADQNARDQNVAERAAVRTEEGQRSQRQPKATSAREAKEADPPRVPPRELLEPPEAEPEQLANHDMDIPEEPETINVTSRIWNPETAEFEEQELGTLTIVPTGCKRPRYLSPYETEVKFKSALPRDRERESNIYSQWQGNGWVSRHWVMDKLDEDINIVEIDKQIADDIPFILALKGKPKIPLEGQAIEGVAQTAGVQGDANGAPPPPAPGPGKGNVFAAGDNLAQQQAPGQGVTNA